jgi:glycosyltransferase involved in cell wall biosynthesis
MNPALSVIIPTYNRADRVSKAIGSVLEQTFADLEVIVVDDGSSDDTRKTLGETFGDRIRYYAQANQGVSGARNRGIAEARGEWIAFLDSDDLWEKDKLEWQLEALKQFSPNCGACYTDTRFLNHAETRTLFQMAEASYRHEAIAGVNEEVLRLLVKPGGAGMVIHVSSFVGRADVVRRTGGFNAKLRYSEDSEFMFRLALLTNFCYVNRPLVWFDRSPVQIRHVGVSADWDKLEFFLHHNQVRLEGLLRLNGGLPREIYKLIEERLACIHSAWTNWHLAAGDYRRARQAVSKAVLLDPTFNTAAKWLMTFISPTLALRSVRRHQERQKDSASIV